MGPHPFPCMVRELQRVVGDEARSSAGSLLDGADPDVVVACVGGGSNAAGTFAGFVDTAARAGRRGGGRVVRRSSNGIPGVLHGMRSQPHAGRAGPDHSRPTRSRPGSTIRVSDPSTPTWPSGRASYVQAGDEEVLEAFELLARTEGIIPALESAHALAWVVPRGRARSPRGRTVLITLSGRGDKDVAQVRGTP